MRIRDLLRLNHVSLGRECPECGERASHEDNGTRGRRAFCLPKGGECQSCPETGADVLVTCAELGS